MRVKEVAIVIPARNEQELVVRCLKSIDAAIASLRRFSGDHPPRISVTVVADGCSDATVDLVRLHPDIVLLEQPARGVGIARRVGVAQALLNSQVDPEEFWIANTDADSRVRHDWLTEQLALADSGADVLVGTVRPDFGDLTGAQTRAWIETRTDGQPNGHVHGANLGIRASTYLLAGGFAPVDEHEDVLLVDRARSAGAVVVATDRTQVVTSGRQAGRTPGGYARYLREDLIARARVLGTPEVTSSQRDELSA